MDINAKMKKITAGFTSLSGVATIRRGLVSLIPVLLVGAFSLMIRYLPFEAYREFIGTFADGVIDSLLGAVYDVTFGLLSVYMCVSLGYHYANIKAERGSDAEIGCPIAATAAFIILTGISNLNADTLGPKGMFISIVSALGSSALFCFMLPRFKRLRLMTDGADASLNNAISLILPLTLTLAVFAVINYLIMLIYDGSRLADLFHDAASALFSFLGDGFWSGFLFVLVSSLLWFFGIHGSDVLEGVSAKIFAPKVDINIALEAAGQAPTEILTKQFFDIFVLMGGCGSAMCLLIALLIFGKRKANRGLAKMAAFPMAFNINEIMVFGLPIIYNPVMLIPFLTVPLVCFLTSYFAMAVGLVPMITSSVEWTIPVIFGGYLGTGSVAGSLLQLFNLALGVMIYRPFVKKYDEERLENEKRDCERLTEILKESERNRTPVSLIDLPGADGAFANSLAAEIEHAIKKGKIALHYQPQYDINGNCFGAETLMRYEHPSLGMLYPPLVVELARETGKLSMLERYIFTHAAADAEEILNATGRKIKVSVNVTADSIEDKSFERFLDELVRPYGDRISMCIEITEQAAVDFNDELRARIARLRDVGYLFAIDDFSAGNTSIKYLQENLFDFVKLDGSIVVECPTNPRCEEIVTMIIDLSRTLGFSTIAEFVSTEEIRDCMARIGCTMYQGWFYSPAIDRGRLISKLTAEKRPMKTEV